MKKLVKKILATTYKGGIPLFLNRGEIPAILNARGLTGEGAEIGVKMGQFSEFLLDHWKGRRLYSVDPWLPYTIEEYDDADNVSAEMQDRNFRNTTSRLARFGERTKILRMTSEEATREIADGALDFVYLDARHDYDSVKEDIAFWWPKVRRGGVMAGHDYLDGRVGRTKFGVKPAVDEFVKREKLVLHVTLREPVYKSWLVLKP